MSNGHQKSSRTSCLFGHQHLPVKAGLKVTFVLPSALALRLIWQIVGLIWRPVSHCHFFEFSFHLCCGLFTCKTAFCCHWQAWSELFIPQASSSPSVSRAVSGHPKQVLLGVKGCNWALLSTVTPAEMEDTRVVSGKERLFLFGRAEIIVT